MTAALGQSHDEDGRSRDFGLDRTEGGLQLVVGGEGPNALAATALGGLDHQRVAQPSAHRASLLEIVNGDLLVYAVGNGHAALGISQGLHVHRDLAAIPGERGNTGGLGDERGVDFVAETLHRTGRGTEEENPFAGETLGEGGVLGGVAPACPHSVHGSCFGDFEDAGDIGVIVVVGASGHFKVLIGHSNVSRRE